MGDAAAAMDEVLEEPGRTEFMSRADDNNLFSPVAPVTAAAVPLVVGVITIDSTPLTFPLPVVFFSWGRAVCYITAQHRSYNARAAEKLHT